MKEPRPDYVTDEHLEYLDDLRESGVTNMMGAGAYLDNAFPELDGQGKARSYQSSPKARDILIYWMNSYSERHPKIA